MFIKKQNLMTIKIKNIYMVGILALCIVSTMLVLYSVMPVQKASAGWITSDLLGDDCAFCDNVLGIDPPAEDSNGGSNNVLTTAPLSSPCTANSILKTAQVWTVDGREHQDTVITPVNWSSAKIKQTLSDNLIKVYQDSNLIYAEPAPICGQEGNHNTTVNIPLTFTNNQPFTLTTTAECPCGCGRANAAVLYEYTYCVNPPAPVTPPVISHDHKACSGNNVYWYDSTNTINDVFQTCATSQVCQNAQCVNTACSSNFDCGTNGLNGSLFCQGNNVYQNYITYTCNNPGTASSSCINSTSPQLQNTCSGNQACSSGSCINSCTSNYQQRCSGNNLYWYDSCGTQQNLIQYCQNGCSGNVCQSSNYNNYTYHSSQKCSGNNLYWFDSYGTQQDLAQYCQNGCYNNYCQANQNTSASINVSKTIKNLTGYSSGFSNSVSANPSDVLMFMITIQNTGNQDATNVIVKDTLSSNLTYNNQLVVSGSSNYNWNNYNGNIVSGVNIGTILPNQTATVTYQAQVASTQNFSYGTTTLNNSTFVTSYNAGNPTATASVIITRSAVLGASTISTGLTNNFWVDSFFLPLVLTLFIIWMWRSGMLLGIEKWFTGKRGTLREFKANRELTRRITKLRN